jgi:hypothetical protein
VLGGVHCDIYKSSYHISNISYLNLPSLPFSFIPPHSWNSFTSYHFSIYIRAYTLFTLYLPSHTLCYFLSLPTRTNPPQEGPVLSSSSLVLLKKRAFVCLRYTGCFFVIFAYIYMYYNPNWFISFVFYFLP